MTDLTAGEIAVITYGILVLLVAFMFGLVYWHERRREKQRNHIDFEWNPTPVRYPDEHEEGGF